MTGEYFRDLVQQSLGQQAVGVAERPLTRGITPHRSMPSANRNRLSTFSGRTGSAEAPRRSA
ncbi:hypothetical protein GCM10027199_82420 [Amycolatopsis magusensis]